MRSVRYLARNKTLGVEFQNWHDRHGGCASLSLALILESPVVDRKCIIVALCPVTGQTPAQTLHVRHTKYRRACWSCIHPFHALKRHSDHTAHENKLLWLAAYQLRWLVV